MSSAIRFAVACTALSGLLGAAPIQATDVATRPLTAGGLVRPNAIFIADNTSSMGWDVLLDTEQGMLWWDTSLKAAWDASGKPYKTSSVGYGSLFPIAVSYTATNGANYYSVGGAYGDALPPTKQFAAMWSSAYNPLYYDPTVTYKPWTPANLDGVSNTRTAFLDATATAAPSHPGFTGSIVKNLTVQSDWLSGTSGYTIYQGMLIPKGATDSSGAVLTTDRTAASKTTAHIPLYPATYWKLEGCTVAVDDQTCAFAPASTTTTLKRYQIAAGTSEMQNFANWWTYYRQRRLMAAASVGQALENITGFRLGAVKLNGYTAPAMYDAEASDDASNRRRVAGFFDTVTTASGTPTVDAMTFVGEQYRTNSNVIQYSCQRNNLFVVTDGLADRSPSLTPAAYDATTYGTGAPYQTTAAGTQANVALSYFTSQYKGAQTMRTDLPTGNVPLGDQTRQNRDSNPNLHMNTYVVTLGVNGTKWPATTDAFATPFTWPTATLGTPAMVDDLWHATLNGRGQMYQAKNAIETAALVAEGLDDMQVAIGAQSSVAVGSVNLGKGDGFVYTNGFNADGWTGDIKAFQIDKVTGVPATTSSWSAADKLAAKDWKTRVIATSDGSVGSAFNATSLGGTTDQAEYLRGNRSKEGNPFHKRKGLIGAIINSQPVASLSDGVLYVASSEGMLHAFDTKAGNEGTELWAYAPQSALSTMVKSTSRTWGFRTLLDGSPVLAQIGSTKLLIGGRGAAGPGYYALDVTSPRGLMETDLVARVKWEFPAKQGVTTAGLAVGKPVVVETRTQGTVVLLTQGFNGSNDASGSTPLLYMLDAMSGALKYTFSAAVGTSSENRAMVQVSALLESDGKVVYVYGGDEKGNLWKFDLETKAVTRLAQLKDAAGLAQPITTAPELARINGNVIVFVGTGRLVGLQDFDATGVQSFYAIKEGTELSNPRSSLTLRALTRPVGSTHWTLAGSSFSWSSSRGWYFDVVAGEQSNTDPTIVDGVVAFTANLMSKSNCKGSSSGYVASVETGLSVGDVDAMTSLGNTNASGFVAVGFGTGKRELLWQGHDGTIGLIHLPPPPGLPTRKNAWRQIHRE